MAERSPAAFDNTPPKVSDYEGAAMNEKQPPQTQSSCCTPAVQATCCEPSEKAACCGTQPAGKGCGCQ
jgi:hypothetical protein